MNNKNTKAKSETMRKTWREWRNEKGYRTSFVAELLGITPSTVCHKENGYGDFNIDETAILLDLYGIDFNQVIRVKKKN